MKILSFILISETTSSLSKTGERSSNASQTSIVSHLCINSNACFASCTRKFTETIILFFCFFFSKKDESGKEAKISLDLNK